MFVSIPPQCAAAIQFHIGAEATAFRTKTQDPLGTAVIRTGKVFHNFIDVAKIYVLSIFLNKWSADIIISKCIASIASLLYFIIFLIVITLTINNKGMRHNRIILFLWIQQIAGFCV